MSSRMLCCRGSRLASYATRALPAETQRTFSSEQLGGGKLSVKLATPNDVRWDQPTGLFIDNQFVEGRGEQLCTVNPFTEEEICMVETASVEDVDLAVQAARKAFQRPSWANPATRSDAFRHLVRMAEGKQNRRILSAVESLDNGKSIELSRLWDVPELVRVFKYYADLTRYGLGGTVSQTADGKKMARIVAEPVGVVGAIVPWNYPLAMAAWKLAPALACGNTVVLKLSEQTPLSMLYMCSLIQQAFPPGVINVVNGRGDVAGRALCEHEDVDKIAFTGSTATGVQVMKAAATTLKDITLETGGKSPLVVFKDADLKKAIRGAHEGIMSNQGQVCTATSRILVHAPIYKQFVEGLQKYTQANSVMGDPFAKATTQGPQISSEQARKINEYIDSAREAGATVWQSPQDLPGKGFFVKPTLVTDVPAGHKILREEVFGPVATITPFAGEAGALAMANDTKYGLAGAVYTRNAGVAQRMAKGIQAGTVWINCNQETDCSVPFGGFKQSGIGRELGEAGLQGYYHIKSVYEPWLGTRSL